MLPLPDDELVDDVLDVDEVEDEDDEVLDPVPLTVWPSSPTRPVGPLLGTQSPEVSPAVMKMPLP